MHALPGIFQASSRANNPVFLLQKHPAISSMKRFISY